MLKSLKKYTYLLSRKQNYTSVLRFCLQGVGVKDWHLKSRICYVKILSDAFYPLTAEPRVCTQRSLPFDEL